MFFENRPIRQAEIDVIRATLAQAMVSEVDSAAIAAVPGLVVVDGCACGCATVDFVAQPSKPRPKPLGDGIGETRRGGKVGVIVWGVQNAITGLEIYDLGAEPNDLTLPVPESIVPWESRGAND